MGKNTSISWTDVTWNCAVGCTKLGADCKFCYMYRDSFDGTRYNPMVVRKTKTVFNLPLKIKEPSKIFTCSLTDFFHPDIDSFRNEAWDIIRKCPQHTFQILTKRPERILEHLPPFWKEIRNHVWLGTSVGSQESVHRIIDLVGTGLEETILFLSLEPLHGEVILPRGHIKFIDWVITGGESGNETGKYRYRPCKLEWIERIVSDCKNNNIPVFVKQLGTHLSKELKMSDRHGTFTSDFPEHLRIQQFPTYTYGED